MQLLQPVEHLRVGTRRRAGEESLEVGVEVDPLVARERRSAEERRLLGDVAADGREQRKLDQNLVKWNRQPRKSILQRPR